jgi:hypothetical protein
MLRLQVRHDGLLFGDSLRVCFMRTPRVSDQHDADSTPQDFGEFPMFIATDYLDSAPPACRVQPSIMIPMHPHEAMWIRFSADDPKPTAVKVGVDGVNAVTGDSWHERLSADPQDYLVCPEQTRLDGHITGNGDIRQFTAASSNKNHGIRRRPPEHYNYNSIWLMVFESRNPPPVAPHDHMGPPERGDAGIWTRPAQSTRASICMEKPRLAIQPDRYGIHTWDTLSYGWVCVYLVNTLTFLHITGQEMPPSPIPIEQRPEDDLACVSADEVSRNTGSEKKPSRSKYKPWVRGRWRKTDP